MKPDTAAIRKIFLERSDSLDAGSYVQGLCGRVEELEALLAEINEPGRMGARYNYLCKIAAQFGHKSIEARPVELAIDEGINALRALLTEAAEALAGSRCHNCGIRICDGTYAGCRTCRPTRALLERLRGSR